MSEAVLDFSQNVGCLRCVWRDCLENVWTVSGGVSVVGKCLGVVWVVTGGVGAGLGGVRGLSGGSRRDLGGVS